MRACSVPFDLAREAGKSFLLLPAVQCAPIKVLDRSLPHSGSAQCANARPAVSRRFSEATERALQWLRNRVEKGEGKEWRRNARHPRRASEEAGMLGAPRSLRFLVGSPGTKSSWGDSWGRIAGVPGGIVDMSAREATGACA
jgi:hypothetical protein